MRGDAKRELGEVGNDKAFCAGLPDASLKTRMSKWGGRWSPDFSGYGGRDVLAAKKGK